MTPKLHRLDRLLDGALAPFAMAAAGLLKHIRGRGLERMPACLRACAAIEAVDACLQPLPPYSPDLNPIEMMWSKIKTFLRAAKARTPEDLTAALAAALRTVTPSDAHNWFTACGYIIS